MYNDDNFHSDLYDISYVWYSCIGSSLVVIVALLSACFVSSQVQMVMMIVMMVMMMMLLSACTVSSQVQVVMMMVMQMVIMMVVLLPFEYISLEVNALLFIRTSANLTRAYLRQWCHT